MVVKQVTEADSTATIHVNGMVRSRYDVMLPARSAGELLWSFEEGTRVNRGDVIAQTNRDQLELRLAEQRIAAERALINQRYLNGEVERLQALQQLNLAAQNQLAEMTSRRDFASNDLLAAEARIAQLENSLERTAVVSPIDGMIVERHIEAGEFARVGEAIARIVDTAALEISASIPMANLNRIDEDADVLVSLPELQFTAKTRAVIRAGETSSQTFEVIIDIPSALAGNLATGQFVQVDVPLLREHALYVPRDAVILRADGSYVFRIGDDNVAQRVKVILGAGEGQMVAIKTTGGELAIGDRVAVRGVESLRDGQPVEPING